MIVKSLALLLCFVVVAECYNCIRPLPRNCVNHPSITLIKTAKIYQLLVCADGRGCLPAGDINNPIWINCSNICKYCYLLAIESG